MPDFALSSPSTVDVAFALAGEWLPSDHRMALAQAVREVLPWLQDEPCTALHRLNLSAGAAAHGLLSGRTRLTLRVPRQRALETQPLAGACLTIGGQTLRVGRGEVRELVPWGTLYSHLVVASVESGDELLFQTQLRDELETMGVDARLICGREQRLESGSLVGFSVMLDRLSATHAAQLLDRGLGIHHHLGCGVFVPHKSASAVGTPPDW